VHSSLDFLLAIYGFAVQIYCDFSGYTDMAIGLALLLRVRLPNNFSRPYLATSVADFWRRWHITLSLWLRDYIYIPLGGNRCGYRRRILNVMVTMAIGGLWHGANWTFVIWGVLHGIGIVASDAPKRVTALSWMRRAPDWLKIAVTFHFVLLAWVFFRAPDLSTVKTVIAGPFVTSWQWSEAEIVRNGFVILLIVAFFLLHRFDRQALVRKLATRLPAAVIWPVLACLCAITVALSAGSSAKFIYFDF